MGMHLTSPRDSREPCRLFEDCGVSSAERVARGIPCPDFASPSCAASGNGALKARLAIRQAMHRVRERLREAAADAN